MRIGEVSRKYGISINNLNYYINFGLLVPSVKGGQRDFDARSLQDLELIIELKNFKFTLNEIYKVITLRRISNLASRKDIQELIDFYKEKRNECVKKAENYTKIAGKLKEKVSELNYTLMSSESKIGVPIRMLELLCCPDCGNNMDIFDGQMNLRYMFQGTLKCQCGYRADICNGILLTPNKNKDVHDTPDVDRDMYKHLPPHLITLYQRAYNWMVDKLDSIVNENTIVMETYVNAWFFIHNHLEYLHPKGRYIIVDKYPETLAAYKQIIEKQGLDLDILYISDSGTKLPIKQGSIDVNIDFFAINEHNFYHQSFLLDRLKPYFSPKAYMLGTYFYFDKGKKSLEQLLKEYPTCSEHNFNLYFFKENMKKQLFSSMISEDVGYVTDCGENIGFSFHQNGEHMHLFSYLAQYND